MPHTVYNIYWVVKDLTRLNVNMNTRITVKIVIMDAFSSKYYAT